jgi:hypothetical protein
MSVEAFGPDRDDIESTKFKKYRGKTGNTDRIGIIYEDPKKMFKGAKTHFKDRFFLCKSDKNKKEICCTHSYENNRPRWRVGAVIVVYDLVVKDGKTKLKGYEMLPWVFSEKMYQKLSKADQEFPLAQHDIKLTCSNEDFQTIDIQSCRDSIWSGSEEMKKRMLEEAAPLFDDVSRNLAADLSVVEIRELLGIDAPGSEDAATDVDLENVMDSL